MIGKVLFVAQRLPDLNGKGDQILLAKRILALRATHEVDLIVVSHSKQTIGELYGCNLCKLIRVPFAEVLLNLLAGLVRLTPFQFALFYSGEGKKYLKKSHASYSAIIGVTSRSASMLYENENCYIDFIDSLSLNFSRRAYAEKSYLYKFLFWAESKMLLRAERNLVSKKKGAIFVSKVDTDHLKVCSNSLISPVSLYVDKYSGFQTNQDIESGFRFVFSGNLGYFPNRYSLELILNEIWPSLRAEYPKCKLFVVGRSASQELISMLADTESVEYIGEVDDIKKELVKYHFALCPMYAGSGMQLKMLEAMALGLPVITNKLGIGDIKNIGQAYVTETVGDLLVLLSSHNQERHRVMANLARRVIDLEYSQIENDKKYLEYIGAK